MALEMKTLPDGQVDGPEPLLPPPGRDTFLVRVMPLSLLDISLGKYY